MYFRVTDKPPFKQLTMADVNHKMGTNGYKVVSTFSGAGGSSLGLKLAGFNIVYANEFITEAQNTYLLNHKDTYLDKRDIRDVTGKEILDIINLEKGELDLFEGSPPCASFSRAGKGTEGWNCVKKYSDTKQRVDDLFFEYIRLIKDIQPKMVLAENVPDLANGKNKGMLKIIVSAFRNAGYEIELRLIDGTKLDIPQTRKRIIFIGRRKDLNITINYPKPKNYSYTVEDAIPNFENNVPSDEYSVFKNAVKLQERFDYCRKHHLQNFADASQILEGRRLTFGYSVVFKDKPSPTLLQDNPLYHGYQNRSISIDEAKIIQTFPLDFELTGSFNKKWERLGRSVPPRMYEAVGKCIKKSLDDYYEQG